MAITTPCPCDLAAPSPSHRPFESPPPIVHDGRDKPLSLFLSADERESISVCRNQSPLWWTSTAFAPTISSRNLPPQHSLSFVYSAYAKRMNGRAEAREEC